MFNWILTSKDIVLQTIKQYALNQFAAADYKKISSTLLLCAVLSACSVSEPEKTIAYVDQHSPLWQQQLQHLNQIKTYRSSGQLGYISPEERFSTRFDWQFVDDQHYQLHLSSALSATTMTFRMTPQGLVVTDNKGNRRAADNPQALLQEIVGMEFPIELFSYWLKGQPQGSNQYKVGQDYVLAELNYTINGQRWQAKYTDYYLQQQPPLPKDILISGERQQLKIRVDEWKF
ncbi:lipoprotein localization protein LolB [Pasteurellaceae bacterium USgator11]|nr:lipoprotein localization protein LolB [Pasteurellaceae bacterium USgator41]TNG94357.1 lipoprotein localization protein LolB [Pasteurellaceae bacterium UScroc12]TNH00192.1 lipoprotein localization protein LolB [Pasteurellaceae bacterium USgator11]TNH01757.1 lipoprotein localization protein LolB [Pasteurellaceae bacterium UScroc31]